MSKIPVMSDSLRAYGVVHGILEGRIVEWVAVPFSRVGGPIIWFDRTVLLPPSCYKTMEKFQNIFVTLSSFLK